MAREKKDADTAADEGAPQVAVAQNQPEIEVEILDDVQGFINGEPITPGERYWVLAAEAMNLVQIGHAKITGSR